MDRHTLLVRCQAQLHRAGRRDDLDASLLLLARTGFTDGKDPRFTGTIKAIRAELAEGSLLYRFSGAREIEGAFGAVRSGSSTRWCGTGTHARPASCGTS